MSLQSIITELHADMGASRVTLRQHRSDATGDGVFPVSNEALAEGIGSLIGVETPNMPGQPVVHLILAGEQVVQPACREDFIGDEPYHAMLELYGGMRAQIVTPVRIDGATVAIISVHQLGRARDWSEAEIDRCQAAAAAVRAELERGPAAA